MKHRTHVSRSFSCPPELAARLDALHAGERSAFIRAAIEEKFAREAAAAVPEVLADLAARVRALEEER